MRPAIYICRQTDGYFVDVIFQVSYIEYEYIQEGYIRIIAYIYKELLVL